MLRLAFITFAAALATVSCGEGPPAPFRAGAAAIDVTPSLLPLPMIGSFRYRPAESAHDPLHSRALVLDDGTTQLAIAVVDSCYIPRGIFDEAKRRASAACGLAENRMLISATHTHSAPPAAAGVGLRGPESESLAENERAYQEQLTQGIADSITAAHGNLQPAEIGWAATEVPDEVFNRRWFMKPGSIPPDPFGGTSDQVKMNPPRASSDLERPAGPTDPEVSILSLRRADGAPLALLANYSLHYVGGTPPGQLSADYFGEFARQISERLSADERFVAILSNGTSGNINNIDFTKPSEQREPFEQIRKVASKVAAAAVEAQASIKHRARVDLAMAESELTLALRKPSPELYEQSKKMLESVKPSEYTRPHIYAQRALALQDGPDTTDVKLQALRIGELGIAALPFETFVETGLELKRESPLKPTFTIELANGAEKYLPTPEHHELGGYETWLGTNQVETQASEKIIAELLNLLRQVQAAGE